MQSVRSISTTGGLYSLTLCELRGYPKAISGRCAGRGAPLTAPVPRPAGTGGHSNRPGCECRNMATLPERDPATACHRHFINSARLGGSSRVAVTTVPTLQSRARGGSDPPPIRARPAPARSLWRERLRSSR